MFKVWIDMWKHTFNFTGTVTRKEYWLALIMNVIVMYVGVIPYALITKNITDNVTVMVTIYLIAVHLPTLAIYFRRARSAGWKTGTAVYNAITIPILSGLIVGMISTCGTVSKSRSLVGKIFALSFGFCFYGGVLGYVLYGDPNSIAVMPMAGVILGSLTLLGYGIFNWREVLAFFAGINMD